MQILIFSLNNQKYGIELKYCTETNKLQNITNFYYKNSKNFKFYIEGISNLRGEIITIMNLKKLLSLENSEYKEYNIIRLKTKNNKMAILIDEVHDIIDVKKESIDYSRGHISQNLLKFIKFTILHQHQPILIFNPEEL